MERLRRYGARGALALECFEQTEDGRIAYRMKRPMSAGTTHLLCTGMELLRPLAAADGEVLSLKQSHCPRSCPPAAPFLIAHSPGHPSAAPLVLLAPARTATGLPFDLCIHHR